MPVDEVNGIELCWERAGSGPRLLFCNGSGSTLADAQPLLEVLAGRFDLLSWDHRGVGRSGPALAPYRMADLAADVEGLLELVGWEACNVVGVSFGGMVAQEFAVTHPDRVERLALMCTSAGGEGGSSYPLHELAELPAGERAAIGLRIADSRWNERWLVDHPGDRALVNGWPREPDPAGAPGLQAQLAARADHDVWDRLDAITCPTLVAFGRYDGIAPAKNSEAIASRISGAQLRGYEGGHLFLAQDPAALPELVSFLRASAADARGSPHVLQFPGRADADVVGQQDGPFPAEWVDVHPDHEIWLGGRVLGEPPSAAQRSASLEGMQVLEHAFGALPSDAIDESLCVLTSRYPGWRAASATDAQRTTAIPATIAERVPMARFVPTRPG